MTAETLALLDTAETAPDPDVTDPSDQDEQQNESPEEQIARGVIPEGYTRDPKTKEIRPKKARGRPRLGTAAPRPDTPITRKPDESPDSKVRGKVRQSAPKYQKGVIAAGMTKMYRRVGRIVKAMDKDIGTAIIECAEDCGEAWDELARTNPRVRAFLLRLIGGGAVGAVVWAHLPILLAIMMKDGIRSRLPGQRFLNAMLDDSEDESDANPLGDLIGNMSSEDMQQMMNMAQNLMGPMAARVAQNGASGE